MNKHRLKMGLRDAYARLLYHTGLHALVNRMMPARLTILAGHCVAPGPGDPPWPGGEHLPADMKIAREKLEDMVAWFRARYAVGSIAEGVAGLGDPDANGGGSFVALSMDDGYRDNCEVMLPLLERQGVSATIFLESRPLDERRVNWSHKLFWILARQTPFDFVHRYGELTEQRAPFPEMNQIVTEDRAGNLVYHVKRILKYEADPAERDAAVDAVFAELGGDEAELCAALYMTWDQARELRDAGVELGGHTVGHPILSRIAPEEKAREVAEGRAAMERELAAAPVTFAYPWGRRWDFDDEARDAVRRAGFQTAVTMHGGTNDPATERTLFHRLAIDDGARMHLLVAEACGGFDLARRLGVDLSE